MNLFFLFYKITKSHLECRLRVVFVFISPSASLDCDECEPPAFYSLRGTSYIYVRSDNSLYQAFLCIQQFDGDCSSRFVSVGVFECRISLRWQRTDRASVYPAVWPLRYYLNVCRRLFVPEITLLWRPSASVSILMMFADGSDSHWQKCNWISWWLSGFSSKWERSVAGAADVADLPRRPEWVQNHGSKPLPTQQTFQSTTDTMQSQHLFVWSFIHHYWRPCKVKSQSQRGWSFNWLWAADGALLKHPKLGKVELRKCRIRAIVDPEACPTYWVV